MPCRSRGEKGLLREEGGQDTNTIYKCLSASSRSRMWACVHVPVVVKVVLMLQYSVYTVYGVCTSMHPTGDHDTFFLHLLWMVSRFAGEGSRGVKDECPPAIHPSTLVQCKTAQVFAVIYCMEYGVLFRWTTPHRVWRTQP